MLSNDGTHNNSTVIMLRLSGKAQREIRHALAAMLSPADSSSVAQWHLAVMNAVMPLTDAYKAAVREREGSSFRMTPLGFEDSAIREHQEYYHRFDFGQALGGRQVKSTVFSRNAYYSDFGRLLRSEYYCDYLSKYRVFDALCISSRKEQHEKGVVLYLWHERERSSSWRSSKLAILSLMAPAFRAGAAAASSAQVRHGQIASLVDSCSDGCALFTKTGSLLHMNPALSSMLQNVETRAELSMAVSTAGRSVQQICFAQSLQVSEMSPAAFEKRAGGTTYRVTACVVSDADGQNCPSILVTVHRVGQNLASSTGLLRDRFDLTQRETEVAVLLADRYSNHELAERLGISEHTARHHTESVMRKLGVADRRQLRQAVLVNSGN
jgi:DNA-binding CsgD family transcriptional regulator